MTSRENDRTTLTFFMLVCEYSRPSSLSARVAFRKTPLGPGAKKDGCFRRLFSCLLPSLEDAYEKLVPSFSLDRVRPHVGTEPKVEPHPGDSLLFKSDLMPLLSPTLPRYPRNSKGLGFQLTGARGGGEHCTTPGTFFVLGSSNEK